MSELEQTKEEEQIEYICENCGKETLRLYKSKKWEFIWVDKDGIEHGKDDTVNFIAKCSCGFEISLELIAKFQQHMFHFSIGDD